MIERPRLRGHGLTIAPTPRFRIERALGAPETKLRIGGRVIDLAADAARDPSALGDWRIETASFSCAWPSGTAITDDTDGLSPFLLHGAGETMAWIAGPLPRSKVTPASKLATESQRIRAIADRGDDVRVDIDYAEDDELWVQRKHVRAWPGDRALLVTAQGRAKDEAATFALADDLATSLR